MRRPFPTLRAHALSPPHALHLNADGTARFRRQAESQDDDWLIEGPVCVFAARLSFSRDRQIADGRRRGRAREGGGRRVGADADGHLKPRPR